MIEPDDETPTDVHLQAAPALAGAAASASLDGAAATIAALTQNAGELLLVLRGDAFPVAGGPDALLGPPPHQLTPERLRTLLHPADRTRLDTALEELTAQGGRRTLSLRATHADGRPLQLGLTLVNRTGDPLVDGIVFHLRDETERDLRDPVTGLPNRDHFLARFQAMLDEGDVRVALILVSLERFAYVQRTLGREAAEALLSQATRRLEDLAMPSWTLARVDEAEFGLLVRGGLPSTAIARLEEDIGRLGREPFDLKGQAVISRVTVASIVPSEDARDADRILRDADEALGLMRNLPTGENPVFADALPPPDARATEAALSQALDEKSLRLAWQPVVTLDGDDVVELEALLRWKSETHGTMAPLAFLPVARSCGLIGPVGAFVLRSAINQLRRWRSKLSPTHPLRISVNVSPEEIADPGWVRALGDTVSAAQLPPRSLQIEVPPSALHDHPSSLARALEAVRELGVRVALDDFGAGVVSVRQLQELPLDAVKIAPVYVSGPFGVASAQGGALLGAMVQLAQGLGLETIAKGVETEAQLDVVRGLGVKAAQGHLLGKPAGPRAVRGRLG